MNTITARVIAIDSMDADTRAGATLRTADGHSLYLYLEKATNPMEDLALRAALSHGDDLEIGYEPTPLRLGAPAGRIVQARSASQPGERMAA